MNDRCPNTIHSDYVTDHRCLRERGHRGDCAFGACGAMHDYCNHCGRALSCPLDKEPYDDDEERTASSSTIEKTEARRT